MNFKITLEDIGRRFNREWIFRGLNFNFISGKTYAILGPNGSGKSTLFQVLNGSLSPSAGKINYSSEHKIVEPSDVYRYLAIAAPYLELIEEFTLAEVVDFHFKFKPYTAGMDSNKIIQLLSMEDSRDKLIRYFSSGMKQRLKLALAFCSDTPMLLLDEPTSNLDSSGVEWYFNLIKKFTLDRLTVICSNQVHEYSFCDERLNITNYKGKR